MKTFLIACLVYQALGLFTIFIYFALGNIPQRTPGGMAVGGISSAIVLCWVIYLLSKD